MKCSNCSAVCMDTDRTCYACNQPLRGATSSGSPYPARIATIFACFGACLGPIVGETYFPQKSAREKQTANIVNAGIGGAIGGPIGLLIGHLFCSRRKPEEE
jgi:hypothetical protein